MVKLIVFEYRKHFLKMSIIVAVLLFSILNVVKIYSLHEQNSLLSKSFSGPHWKGLYWKMYEDFGGTITDDKIRRLMDIYRPLESQTADHTASTAYDNPNTYTGNVYEDYYFFLWCYVNPMKYAYNYKAYAHDVVNAARDNTDFFKSLGNEYEYKKNAVITGLFRGRSIPDFAYTEMYQFYVQYDFSAFLALLICMYGLMSVFISEKETEMDALLLTAKSGGTKTLAAKLISSAIFVCVVCFWFWLLDFTAFSAIFGSMEGASAPLYNIENFADASLNVSLGQYAVLSGLVKTAGILMLGLMFLLVSCLFKNALVPFIISLSITCGLIDLGEIYMGSGHVLPKIINPFVLVTNRELFRKTEFVRLFDFPVPSYISALLFGLVWGAVFLSGIIILVRKNAYGKGRDKRASMEV